MVKTDPKTGRMYTEGDPAPIDIERVRREVRDHITGNGKPWHTDTFAAPAVPQPEVHEAGPCGCMKTPFGVIWCAEHAYDACA